VRSLEQHDTRRDRAGGAGEIESCLEVKEHTRSIISRKWTSTHRLLELWDELSLPHDESKQVFGHTIQ